MSDIFVDCEFNHDGIFLLGAHCPDITSEENRRQLHGKNLTINNFKKIINECSKPGRRTLLFCHGPDFGHIERHFGVRLKNDYICINVITAYKTFTRFQNCSLANIAKSIKKGWRDPDVQPQISTLWQSNNLIDKQRVLDYNWDDCVILGEIVKHLRQRHVTNKKFIDNARLL